MSGRAPPAAPAGRQERRHHVVADLEVATPGPDFLHDACALVPADHRQRHAGQVAGPDMVVGMAQAGGLERHQDLALFRSVEVDLLDTPIGSLNPHSTAAFVFMRQSVGKSGRAVGRIERLTVYCARTSPPSATIQLAKLPTKKYSVMSSIPICPFSRAFWALISGNRMMLLAATTAVAAAS